MSNLTKNVKIDLQMEDPKKILKIFSLITILLAIDLFSKYIYWMLLGMEERNIPILSGYLDFFVTPHEGHTISFFMNDLYNHISTLITIFFITTLFIYPLFFKMKRIILFCLVIISAGGLANLVDKFYNYNATNIMCSIEQSSGLHSVCFNIADFYSLIGISVGFIVNFYYVLNYFILNSHLIYIILIPFSFYTFNWFFYWLISSF